MRSRILSKAQAEVIAVFVLALLLALMVGVAIRFYIMAGQTLKQVEERKREVQQTVLSGGVRGYIDSDTVYLASGVPLLVYSVMIHNGSSILWSNPSPPSGLTSYRISMPVMELSDIYTPVYSGSLTSLIEQCKARVVLVTDKGLIKWCPNIITKIVNNTIISISAPLSVLGSFKVYYVGNITYFALYGNISVSATNDASSDSSTDNSRTTLYPVIIFYNDPVTISEKWSNTVVNVTLRNTVTGDAAWLAFDVAKGVIVGKKAPANSSNIYDIIFYSPDKGVAVIATSMKPISVGGIDVFAFTVYYTKGYGYYAKELFTATQIGTIFGNYMDYGVYNNYQSSEVYYAFLKCYGGGVPPNLLGAYTFIINTKTPSTLYIGVVSRTTSASTFVSVAPVAMSLFARLYRGPHYSLGWTTAYYGLDYFAVNGSSPVQASYYIAFSCSSNSGTCGFCDNCDQKPVTGTGTSWNTSKLCCGWHSPEWYTIKAEARIALPSGATIPIGIYATMMVSSPPPPPPPPPPQPPAPAPPPPPQPSGVAWIYETVVASPEKEYAYAYTTEGINPTGWQIVWVLYDSTGHEIGETTTYPLKWVCGLNTCGYGGYVEIPKNGYVIVNVYRYVNRNWQTYAVQPIYWK